MSIILKANQISKIYGEEKNQFLALENMDLEIEDGTFVTIIGQSGSGKSTLLHILGGLDKPTGNLDSKSSKEVIDLLRLSQKKISSNNYYGYS